MRVRWAALLAAVLFTVGFAAGRLSVAGGVIRGGGKPLHTAELAVTAPTGGEEPAFGKIDINAADTAALCMLPGIGEATAEKIIAYRTENGSFTSAEELMAVDGIGDATYEAIREYIFAGR